MHIAAHTNFDSAPGGVNDTLLALMGAANIRGEGCVRVGDVEAGTTFGALCARAQRKLHAVVRAYGAADTPVTGRRAGCGTCALRGRCEFRKRGETCGS